MRSLRVDRRTAVVGVAMSDLGIIADALLAELGMTEPRSAPMPIDFRTETERLLREVISVIAAMDDYADAHSDAT